MRDKFSFRTRLILCFWIVLVILLMLPAWYYYDTLSGQIVTEARNNTVRHLSVIEWMMEQKKDLKSFEDLHTWLVQFGHQEGFRITYIDSEGRAIADSSVPYNDISKLDNYSTRAEIIQAQTQKLGVAIRIGKHSQKEEIFAAESVRGIGPIPGGFLRMATSFSPAKDQLDKLRSVFLITVALVLIATLLLSRLLIRQLRYPVRKIIDAIETIGTDKYKRIHFLPGQEFYALSMAMNQAAESIEEHNSYLAEQMGGFKAVLNGMQEGVMLLDSKGRIKSVNRALSEIIQGMPQAVGRRPLEVIMSIELQEACDRVLLLRDESTARPNNIRIEFEGNRVYDVSLSALRESEELGAIAVFHDISELERLERVRQDFVANVSHELYTPLNYIKENAQTLAGQKPLFPEETPTNLKVILDNTNHIIKIVEDLLQLAKLEGGRNRPVLGAVNANDALHAAWMACQDLAVEKAIELKNGLPEDGPLVSADHEQLVKLFHNLLENAVRHSPRGKMVSVACLVSADKVSFAVSDEGPGIPKPHQQRIFERFYRVEAPQAAFKESTGLGLAVCRHIVINLGGKIWVESPDVKTNKGTTIHFALLRPSGRAEKPDSFKDSPDALSMGSS